MNKRSHYQLLSLYGVNIKLSGNIRDFIVGHDPPTQSSAEVNCRLFECLAVSNHLKQMYLCQNIRNNLIYADHNKKVEIYESQNFDF